jgi:hypothetical protein
VAIQIGGREVVSVWISRCNTSSKEVIEIGSDDEDPALVGKSECGVNNTLNVMGANLACLWAKKLLSSLLRKRNQWLP